MPAPPEDHGPPADDVTRLLQTLPDGDDARFREVYAELHRIARRHRARWNGNDTLNTTAIVHEAYLKMSGGGYASRAHFLAVAAKAMRHVLIGYAERQGAQKRGGGERPLPLDEARLVPEDRTEEVAALGEALRRLEAVDPRAARVVECRFFAGLSIEETAAALDVSERTVTRDWSTARAWLYGQLRHDTLDVPL